MTKKLFINSNRKEYVFKSIEELYFSYWLDELVLAGFVNNWYYEKDKFELSDPVYLPYQKQLKTKVVDAEEFILHGASCTADFTIHFAEKAKNVFYSSSTTPVTNIKSIPFKSPLTYVEIKPENESTTSSSISFPYKQKWVYQKYGSLIQKVKPFGKKLKTTLFRETFYPKIVLHQEIYSRDCKWGRKGESKLKHATRTLEEYLYENSTN